MLQQTIQLSFTYPVIFTRAAFDPANPRLIDAVSRLEPDRVHRTAVVIDEGVAVGRPGLEDTIRAYSPRLDIAGVRVVPGGERAKAGLALVDDLHRWLLSLRIDRQSVVLAVGGGAVLDMAGFAAATFHRGVRMVRLPTTVLAQNDAAVGVKNGVNQAGVKNLIGSFATPFAVVADFDFLDTLAPRDRLAGLSEAVKVAATRDAAFFRALERDAGALAAFAPGPTEAMIRRSAELHLDHIATGGDPFELGSARPLDFGHWAAHKLESMTAHRLRHGEAVAIGMALDCLYAVEAGLLAAAEAGRVIDLLAALGFRLWDDAMADRATLARGLDEFREHLGGRLTVAMLAGIGRSVDVHAIDTCALDRALAALERRGS
ncbi:MAG: 3-dehydroquinate synthase [Actinomycetota bacterium]